MTPAELFLENNKETFFTCHHFNYPCVLSYKECVKRQNFVKRYADSERGVGQVYKQGGVTYNYEKCLDCEQGRKNQRRVEK